MFLVRTPGTWGEQMFLGGHLFPVDIVTVPEPIEHSVDKRPSEEIEHSDVRGAAAPPSTGHQMEHSGDSGDWQNGRQSHKYDSNTLFGVIDRGTGVPTGCWGGDCGGCRWLSGSLVPDGVG